MSIQRYEHFSDGELRPVQFNKRGDWVKHDDHKAALAKHKDLFNDIRYTLGYRYDELCDRIEAVMEEMK